MTTIQATKCSFLLVLCATAGFLGVRIVHAAPPPPCASCSCKNVTVVHDYTEGIYKMALQYNENTMIYSAWTRGINTIDVASGCNGGSTASAAPQIVYFDNIQSTDLCTYSYPGSLKVEASTPQDAPQPENPQFLVRVACAP